MAARPRSHKISIPNLYCKLDKRTGKVYWQYKHPLSGRFHSLGTDENEAKQVATEANIDWPPESPDNQYHLNK